MTSEFLVGSSKEDNRWMALMDETFLRTVDDLMPRLNACIKNLETELGSAGKAHFPDLAQKAMNSSISDLYARKVFGAYAPSICVSNSRNRFDTVLLII